MNGLMAKISMDITASIKEYTDTLATQYGLDQSELLDLWEKLSGVSTVGVQSVTINPRAKIDKALSVPSPPGTKQKAERSPSSVSSEASVVADGS